jgi:hypothetical protein
VICAAKRAGLVIYRLDNVMGIARDSRETASGRKNGLALKVKKCDGYSVYLWGTVPDGYAIASYPAYDVAQAGYIN